MTAWTPTRAAALARLEAFAPYAGRAYAERRNYDLGPDARDNVSALSPWVRSRAVSERELVDAALEHHDLRAAEKFVQEVCWRTYWKGWLQMRPSVWSDYLERLERDRREHADSSLLRKALEGRTAIPSFNAWRNELVEHGYLHNHARMWFASQWCFTLKLPWTLGADFFFRHLLDGDPASNTLSWRWLAGLHTRGKTYAARPDNVRRYTEGRFGEGEQYAREVEPVYEESGPPKPRAVEALPVPRISGRAGLLLTEEDLRPDEFLEGELGPSRMHAVGGLFPVQAYARHDIAEPVQRFRQELMRDALKRLGSEVAPMRTAIEVATWSREAGLQELVVVEPAVGLWNRVLPELRRELAAAEVQLWLVRRPWDDALWPHATKGFFRLKKQIPGVLSDARAR